MMLRSVMKTKILEKHKTYNFFKFFNSLLFVYYEVDEYIFLTFFILPCLLKMSCIPDNYYSVECDM